jgi:hypothetical protein
MPEPYPDVLVAVDLGKTKVGVALFLKEGEQYSFLSAKTIRAPQGAEAYKVALLVYDAAAQACISAGRTAMGWVCEWPQKYDDKRKYHEDLDSLHAVGHALASLHDGWLEAYRPGAWKGNVPKAAHHRRLRRALTKEEMKKAPPEREHDSWDAVGIGLFATGRTQRGGTT